MKYILILALLFLSNSCSRTSLECGDLLKKYAIKPNKVEFVSCKTGIGQTLLEADYRVLGKDSEEVEKILMEKYGMGELKFVCCGWESENGKNGYVENTQLKTINQDYILEISMFGNAEKKCENGKTELELDRTKVDFTIKVKVLQL